MDGLRTRPRSATKPELAFLTLGPLEVLRDGDPIPLGPPLQRTLLAVLLLEAPRSVPVSLLLERLWSDEPPATAAKSIQKYVSNLRRLLGPERLVSDGGYRLDVDAADVDMTPFEAAPGRARAEHTPRARLAVIDDTLALWRGEPFADLVEPLFLEPVRRRLDEVRIGLLEERLATQLELSNVDLVIAETEELLASYPLRERLWQHRMAALAAAGRQAEALDAYQQLRGTLVNDLGLDPSPETQEIERRILLQEATTSPPPTAAGNLPAQTTRLIGREADLDELAPALERGRLLTLTGPGGVGKTSLALELARRTPARRFGAWFVELGAVSDPERVPGRTAEALGVQERPAQSIADAIADHVADKELLILLDNCEHVIDGAASLSRSLLDSAPELTVVATSRQPLGVAGEVVVPIEPLAVPPPEAPDDAVASFASVELLVERAQQAGARMDDGAASSLGEVCRRLDGMPLAIELAAARLRTFSPEELADRLRTRLELLRSTRRDVPSRHQTLEATIDWSFQLLSKPEQDLFLRLSVFRGTFDLEAVEQVSDLEGVDAPAVLAELVDRSLVVVSGQAGGASRFRMLATIRQFAERLLGAGLPELRARHAEHYADLAGRWSPPETEPDNALLQLSVDYENLRAALAFLVAEGDPSDGLRLALALAHYWSETGKLTEGGMWVERALEAAPEAPADLRIRTLMALSLLRQPSSSASSLEAARLAFRAAEESGDSMLTARAAVELGRLHAVRMELDQAEPLLQGALAALESSGDELELARCYEALGVAHIGHADQGISEYHAAIERFRRLGADLRLAHALQSVSYRSLPSAGRIDEAREALHECLTISIREGSRHTAAHAMRGFAQLSRLAGDRDGARRIIGFALQEFRTMGDRRCLARMQTALGLISTSEGAHAEAWVALRQAMRLALDVDVGTSPEVVETTDGLVLVAEGLGWHETAARWLGAVEGVRERFGLLRPPPDQAAVEACRARIVEELGAGRASSLFTAGAEISLEQVGAEAQELRAPA